MITDKFNYCHICNSPDIYKLGETSCTKSSLPDNATLVRVLYICRNCGSISVNPIPSIDDLMTYYSNYAQDDPRYLSSQEWSKRSSYEIVLDICSKISDGNILDIGCADGQLLSMLPSSFNKFGIDISERACVLSREKGIKAQCSTFKSAEITNKFDLIIALDLIEHLEKPNDGINKISSILKKGGYVIIETGNAASNTARLLRENWSYTSAYSHLHALTPKTLTLLAEKENIKMLLIKEGWHKKPIITQFIYRNFLSYSFHVFRNIYKLLSPLTNKIVYLQKLYYHAPPGAPNRDHMIFVGQKRM